MYEERTLKVFNTMPALMAMAMILACEVAPSAHSEDYLKTKKEKLGHLFTSR